MESVLTVGREPPKVPRPYLNRKECFYKNSKLINDYKIVVIIY